MNKPAYKLKQLAKLKIDNTFYESPLKQEITRKGSVNKFLELELKLDAKKDKGYEIEAIKNSVIYNKAVKDPLYCLVFWKSYSKDESTWKPTPAIMYL